jgi:hypothetical protein
MIAGMGSRRTRLEGHAMRWAKTATEVFHYSNIALQCLKTMTTLRPFLVVKLQDQTIVRGWLQGLRQGDNAISEKSQYPTAWHGSIILRTGEHDVALDFLDVETIRVSLPPIQLFEGFDLVEA